jgi:hypothetical protein
MFARLVDLQPMAIMLQLVPPSEVHLGLLGDDWMGRMDDSDRTAPAA